jgi:hypothetical protein
MEWGKNNLPTSFNLPIFPPLRGTLTIAALLRLALSDLMTDNLRMSAQFLAACKRHAGAGLPLRQVRRDLQRRKNFALQTNCAGCKVGIPAGLTILAFR